MVRIVAIFAAALMLGACREKDHPRIIDIGGRLLYLNCTGKPAGPTVVLDSGSGETSSAWSGVQPAVSRFAHVCSYDRAGSGKSPSAGHPQSIDEEVADLRALLTKAKVPLPYILVGHWSNGLRVRRYQAQFENDIAGMVLVDSSHEEQVWRFLDAISGSVYGIPLDSAGLAKLGMLPPRERLQWHATIPLIVIAHGGHMQLPSPMNQHAQLAESMMRELQQDLASRSPKAQLRIASQSGHDIQVDEPQVVVKAIKDVLEQVKRANGMRKPSAV
ncbi:MAG: hypothetical protein M3Y72_02260 [Acidobacteriota bacterium]|nr:hypothetical protein [Acidobacteriota bacterium]